MSHEKRTEELLEQAVESLKMETMKRGEQEEAASRVRTRIAGELAAETSLIRGCEDFQTLIPAYLDATLNKARVLLLEDHVKQCIPCRRALTAARTQNALPKRIDQRAQGMSPWLKWGSIAAAFLAALLLGQWAVYNGYLPGPTGAVAWVDTSEGQLFTLSENGLLAMQQGDRLRARQVARTAKDSGASLRLKDGSRLEMAARTELSLVRGWTGTIIELRHGSVIVEAAEQRSGSLQVSTGDCRVAVKGTVFSVSHGIRGSRVSVLEGEVWVERSGESVVLQPGQQYASRQWLSQVSLEEEFGWSQDSEKHLAILKEIVQIQKDFQRATYSEQLRFSSDLMGLLPAETVVYGAFPNISSQLGDVYRLFLQRIQENPALQQWFEAEAAKGGDLSRLDELVAKALVFGEELGEEIVLALVVDREAGTPAPVLLARIENPVSLKGLISAEIANLESEGAESLPVLLVDDPHSLPSDLAGKLIIVVEEDLMLVSPSVQLLRSVGSSSGLTPDSGLFQTLAESYSNGVDWLFAADLERLLKDRDRSGEEVSRPEFLEALGVRQIRNLVIERKQIDGAPENRAVLRYEAAPEGLLSWVAKPGPMGGFRFVSQDANMVAAFVINDPGRLVDHLLALLEQKEPEGWEKLVNLQIETGFNIREIASAFGGEFIFALDGPLLPTPSWKIILEIYDEAIFQDTIGLAVAEINNQLQSEGKPGLEVSQSGGLYQIGLVGSDPAAYYRFVAGYLIAAPDPALIDQAQQYSSSGYTLVDSPAFSSLLSQDPSLNSSALFYHNLSPLLEPILNSSLAQSAAGSAGPRFLGTLVGNTPPMMVSLYSRPGEITVSTGGDIESLWMNMSALSALGGPEGIARILGGQIQ